MQEAVTMPRLHQPAESQSAAHQTAVPDCRKRLASQLPHSDKRRQSQKDTASPMSLSGRAQEDPSGSVTADNASDRDSDTDDEPEKARRNEAITAQPVRNSQGLARQGLTMTFLEEGGYFDLPIKEAAIKLRLGITTLKRVCRSNGMTRWPFRKRNSLGRLIDRTKQVLDDGTGQDNMKKLMALQMLEKQRQVMRSCQNSNVEEQAQSYRQAAADHMKQQTRLTPAR
ncbi:TPA: hypothetical protein ACH3X1_015466 [Trebouxia sp. C0004]